MIKPSKYSTSFLFLFYLILWVILFEFILPINNIFPKPSIVLQSLSDLVANYDLILNYFSTISAIYFSLILAYFFAKLIFPFIVQGKLFASVILSIERFTRYLPGILLGLLLIIWFPQSEITIFIFSFFIASTAIISHSKCLAEKLELGYYYSIKTFGLSDLSIYRRIYWKAIQPDLMKFINKQNVYLWISVIIFEFINLRSGMGVIFRQIIQFKDLSALIMCLVIVSFSIFISSRLMNFIKSNIFFWKM